MDQAKTPPLRAVLLLIAVLLGARGQGQLCDWSQVTSCTQFTLLMRTGLQVIPLPEPDTLDEVCSNLRRGVTCILGVPGCNIQKVPYEAMLMASEVPCLRHKDEYLAGRKCWQLQNGLTELLKDCHARSKSDSPNACRDLKSFKDCVVENIATKDNCGGRERYLIDLMITKHYNKIALARNPPCEHLPEPTRSASATTTSAPATAQATTATSSVASQTTTIIATTSTTTTTTTTHRTNGIDTQASTGNAGSSPVFAHILLITAGVIAAYFNSVQL